MNGGETRGLAVPCVGGASEARASQGKPLPWGRRCRQTSPRGKYPRFWQGPPSGPRCPASPPPGLRGMHRRASGWPPADP